MRVLLLRPSTPKILQNVRTIDVIDSKGSFVELNHSISEKYESQQPAEWKLFAFWKPAGITKQGVPAKLLQKIILFWSQKDQKCRTKCCRKAEQTSNFNPFPWIFLESFMWKNFRFYWNIEKFSKTSSKSLNSNDMLVLGLTKQRFDTTTDSWKTLNFVRNRFVFRSLAITRFKSGVSRFMEKKTLQSLKPTTCGLPNCSVSVHICYKRSLITCIWPWNHKFSQIKVFLFQLVNESFYHQNFHTFHKNRRELEYRPECSIPLDKVKTWKLFCAQNFE